MGSGQSINESKLTNKNQSIYNSPSNNKSSPMKGHTY